MKNGTVAGSSDPLFENRYPLLPVNDGWIAVLKTGEVAACMLK